MGPPVHTIRLAGPWELHQPGAVPERVTLPASAGEATTGQLVRKFHCPAGLEDRSRVCLQLSVSGATPHLLLNGRDIAAMETEAASGTDGWRFDVTRSLSPFNVAAVQLQNASGQARLESATMEIYVDEDG